MSGLFEGRWKEYLRRRQLYLVRAASLSHFDPEFLQPIDHRLRCLDFDIHLIVDVSPLDKPTAGIQFGEQVSILLTEKELGFDERIAAEAFVDSCQKRVDPISVWLRY